MSFWIFTGALALVATGAMVVAMLRRREGAAEASASFDVQVYRDQLKELDRDMARGTIGKPEGERARVEISRRLLEADRKAQAGSQAHTAPAGLTYVTAAITAPAPMRTTMTHSRIASAGQASGRMLACARSSAAPTASASVARTTKR